MTPEQRAASILQQYTHECGGAPYSPLFLGRLIAASIRAAVEAEREACAQIAESFMPSGFVGDGKIGNSIAIARDDRSRVIAVTIRARKEPTP